MDPYSIENEILTKLYVILKFSYVTSNVVRACSIEHQWCFQLEQTQGEIDC